MEPKDELKIRSIDRSIELEFETQDFKIEIKMEKRKGGKTE